MNLRSFRYLWRAIVAILFLSVGTVTAWAQGCPMVEVCTLNGGCNGRAPGTIMSVSEQSPGLLKVSAGRRFLPAYPGMVKGEIYSSTLRQQITTRGKEILVDGQEVPLKGVIMAGLLAPEHLVERMSSRYDNRGISYGVQANAAYRKWGRGELQVLKNLGVNLLRIHVSPAALDPHYPIPEYEQFSPAYVTRVACGVALARFMGFMVIIDLQWEPRNGNPDPHPASLPDSTTVHAIQTLAPFFAKDLGVMWEFNEPVSRYRFRKRAWQEWLRGMNLALSTAHCPFGEMRNTWAVTCKDGRAVNAFNIWILDSLGKDSKWPDNGSVPVSSLRDPLDREPGLLQHVIWAIHPFEFNNRKWRREGAAIWDKHFGNFLRAQNQPTLVTAFYSGPGVCSHDGMFYTKALLAYLAENRWSLAGIWIGDFRNRMFQGDTDVLANWSGGNCKTGNSGAAQQIVDWWRTGSTDPR